MKIALVTSLNEKLYHYYGHMFYSSFNWPFDTYVYHEGWTPTTYPKKFIHRNIHETNPELQKFLDRNSPNNVWSTDQKDPSKIIPGTDFKRDACRFAYKVYAKTHLMLDCDYDYVFWVDADAVFLKPITEQYILDKVLPENNTISYIYCSEIVPIMYGQQTKKTLVKLFQAQTLKGTLVDLHIRFMQRLI